MHESKPTPGEAIQTLLDSQGWTHDDLAGIMGRYRPEVTNMISGKRNISPEVAVELATAFEGTTAEYWLDLETHRQLNLLPERNSAEIARRAKLYQMAPVKEMEKRGWINGGNSVDALEEQLKRFFSIDSMDDEPRIGGATRRSDRGEPLTPSQRAWCARVKQLSSVQMVAEFKTEAVDLCVQKLRKIAANPEETHRVPRVLSEHGIRFVVVEPLQSTRVDGVAIWLDQSSPAIGLSLRFDRLDSFWFTLCHELAHIKAHDDSPLDITIAEHDDANLMMVKDEMERLADATAADMLICKEEMDSFVLRVGPLYSKDRVVRFANRIKIHPGIIVGQLQHRKEIGWGSLRDYLPKVRHIVTPAAIVDGWGRLVDSRSLS